MENASKALIIAGAILLAILLISLGILVFNQASESANGNALTDAQKTAFNQKFTKYEGDSVKGSMVKTMMQEVFANNANEDSVDSYGKITLNYAGSEVTTTTADIKTNKSYIVKVTINASTGTVTQIDITNKSS